MEVVSYDYGEISGQAFARRADGALFLYTPLCTALSMVGSRNEALRVTKANRELVENVQAISAKSSTNFLLRSRLVHPLRLGHAMFITKSINLCRRTSSTVRILETFTIAVALKRMRKRRRRRLRIQIG